MDALGEAGAPSYGRLRKSSLPAVRALAAKALRVALGRALSLAWWLDVAAVGIVARVAIVLARPLTYSPLGYDEKFYVYGGYSVLHGQVPYRDFQNLKGPFVSLTEALAVAVFGIDHQGFRLMPLTLGVGGIAAMVAALIQRGVYRLIAMGVGLLVAAYWLDPTRHETTINDTESLVVGYFALALACFLVRTRATSRSSASWSLLGGIFLGATVLVKENFVITAAVAWLAFLFLPRPADPRRARASYIKWSLIGGIGLGVAVTLYLAASGGLRPYLRLITVYPTYANTYCVALGNFHPGPFWAVRKQEWDHLSDKLVNVPLMAPWLPIFAATIMLTKRDTLLFVLGSVATFLASLATINVGHCYWMHYWVLGATGLAALAIPGAEAVSVALRSAKRSTRAWAGVATLAAVACGSYPRYAQANEKPAAPVKREVAPDVQEAIRRYSYDGDYILTTGTPDLYFLTHRLGAHETNGFVDELLVMYPGNTDTDRVAGMRARLEATRPKVVVIDRSSSAYPQRSVRTIHALVDAYLSAHHYVAMGRVWVRPDVVERVGANPPIPPGVGDVTFDAR